MALEQQVFLNIFRWTVHDWAIKSDGGKDLYVLVYEPLKEFLLDFVFACLWF